MVVMIFPDNAPSTILLVKIFLIRVSEYEVILVVHVFIYISITFISIPSLSFVKKIRI